MAMMAGDGAAEPVRVPDDRREPRTMALFREAAIEAGRRVGLCVVKNLSSGGAMIWTRVALQIDEPVTLVMPSGRRAPGRIRWQQSEMRGIAFDGETPPSWLLDRYAECASGEPCRQLPRVTVAAPATVTDRIGNSAAVTCDISTRGMRLAADRALAIGPIAIALKGLPQIKARALWSMNGQAGCIFDRPVPIDELTDWLGSLDHDGKR